MNQSLAESYLRLSFGRHTQPNNVSYIFQPNTQEPFKTENLTQI